MQKLRLLFRHPEFAVLLVGNLVQGLAFSLVLPFASLYATRALGLSPMGYALFMTANAVSGFIITTRLARWSDTHFARKDVLIAAAATGVANYVAYAFLRDPRILLPISCLLLGIASIGFSQTFALARDLLARRGAADADIPFYINVFRLCFALSWTVGPAIGARLLARWSFTGTYLGAAALMALFGMIIAFGQERIPPTEKAKAAAASLPLSKAFRLPGFFAHFLAMSLILSCSTMGMMNLPLLIQKTLGGTDAQVGAAYSLAPFFELPFMYYAGTLAARVPAARILRWAALLAIVYYAGLAATRAPWQVLPLQVLSAAMVAVSSGLAITFFQDFLPGQAGTATNVYSNAARVGGLGGYLLFGVLGTVLGYRSVFWVCAACSALAWGIMHLWRPEKARPLPPVPSVLPVP
jgi:SET family sugar efflux transporter-like MFS transporter